MPACRVMKPMSSTPAATRAARRAARMSVMRVRMVVTSSSQPARRSGSVRIVAAIVAPWKGAFE